MEKPDDLYPFLVEELASLKQPIINFLKASFTSDIMCDSVVDVGGAKGTIIKDLPVKNKYVVDKRDFGQHPNINYIHEEYRADHSNKDAAIFSEFLHLFSDGDIRTIIQECQSKYMIVIENQYDDFLDLRLRLWTGGRCLPREFLSDLFNMNPIKFVGYDVYVVKP